MLEYVFIENGETWYSTKPAILRSEISSLAPVRSWSFIKMTFKCLKSAKICCQESFELTHFETLYFLKSCPIFVGSAFLVYSQNGIFLLVCWSLVKNLLPWITQFHNQNDTTKNEHCNCVSFFVTGVLHLFVISLESSILLLSII